MENYLSIEECEIVENTMQCWQEGSLDVDMPNFLVPSTSSHSTALHTREVLMIEEALLGSTSLRDTSMGMQVANPASDVDNEFYRKESLENFMTETYTSPCRTSVVASELIFQRRPGTRHGKGGRPRGSSHVATYEEVLTQTGIAVCKAVMERFGGNQFLAAKAFYELLDPPEVMPVVGPNAASAFGLYTLQSLKRGFYTVAVSKNVCIATVLKTTDEGGTPVGNLKDRYASCSWISRQGELRCSCFGSTRYRVLSAYGNEVRWRWACVHVEGMRRWVQTICQATNLSEDIVGVTLNKMVFLRYPYVGMAMTVLPTVGEEAMHSLRNQNGNISHVIVATYGGEGSDVTYIPVRFKRKGKSSMSCQFCENQGRRRCKHVIVAAKYLQVVDFMENNDSDEGHQSGSGEEDWGHGKSSERKEGVMYNITSSKNPKRPISRLPLSPINCRQSVLVDEFIASLARSGQYFEACAPDNCGKPGCKGRRNESSCVVHDEGIVMCSAGPCRFRYEEFNCSLCGERMGAEGRRQYIVIDTVGSAGTHAWMRRELSAVALGHGTLSGRLNHFHGMTSQNAFYGLLQNNDQTRSVGSLMRLCKIMLELMCMEPEPLLFNCPSCEGGGRMKALCMDGIRQGFQQRRNFRFTNVSEECKAPARGSKHKATYRPTDNIIRHESVAKLLLAGIDGLDLRCTRQNVHSFASVIRICDPNTLPLQFCPESVCEQSLQEDGSRIRVLRVFLSRLFQADVLRFRFLGPLLHFLKQTKDRQYLRKIGALTRSSITPTEYDSSIPHLQQCFEALQAREAGREHGSVCWREETELPVDSSTHTDIRRMVKVMLQGPSTQVVLKCQISSAQYLARICKQSSCEHLKHALLDPQLLNESSWGNPGTYTSPTTRVHLGEPNPRALTSQGLQNLLANSIVLQSGLFSVAAIENKRETFGKLLRHSCGEVIEKIAECVGTFHDFYDGENLSLKTSSSSYREKWGGTDINALRQRFEVEYRNEAALSGDVLEQALKTGFFFPFRKQIRPLPFDCDISEKDASAAWSECRKDYNEKCTVYTPGAVTYCCPCTFSVMSGILAISMFEKHNGGSSGDAIALGGTSHVCHL